MGYALMSARKIMLTSRINNLNFQIMCLGEAMNSLATQMGNFQRLMSANTMQNQIMQTYSQLSQFMGGSNNNALMQYMAAMMGGCCGYGNMMGMGGLFGNSYTGMGLGNDFMQYFWPYAQLQMIDNDIECQKKQLETQLQVATKELEAVEKAEESAIGRATPKYA